MKKEVARAKTSVKCKEISRYGHPESVKANTRCGTFEKLRRLAIYCIYLLLWICGR
jgi:hypothetical protein